VDSQQPVSEWQKTPYANLVRFVSSGVYFARLRVRGKLIRRSLKTTAITVAKLRLSDLEKKERQQAESKTSVANGTMTFGDALAVYRQRLQANVALKPRSKDYREERITALLKSWPTLEKTDVRKIHKTACLDWASDYAGKISSTNFNNTIGTLRLILEIAMEAGAIYDNPARFIKRVPVRFKIPALPSRENFDKLLALVKHDTVADLIRFLAYGGFRKSEAANVTWADIDLARETILVRGDAETGTKNGEVRVVPMIPEMKTLLERLQTERPDRQLTDPVMKAKECQRSIDTACKTLGIPRFTHHGLRHMFMTQCIESDVDIPTASRWLGHKDGGALAMKRYGHLRDAHSADMAKRVRFSKSEPAAPSSKPETEIT
jgi:integrase